MRIQTGEHMTCVKSRAPIIIHYIIYNKTDRKAIYLFGLTRCFPKFEYVCLLSLEIAPSIISFHFQLECPSCFVNNSNYITQFKFNQEIGLCTGLNSLKQGQFLLWDG